MSADSGSAVPPDGPLLAFWKRQLAGAPHILDLPADRPRLALNHRRAATAFTAFPTDLSQGLRELSSAEEASPAIILLSALGILLSRYTGQEEVIVGSLTAQPAGAYGDPLPIRISFAGDPTFRELLARVRATSRDAAAHTGLQFETLVQELGAEANPAHHPLVQVALVSRDASGHAAVAGGTSEPAAGP